jgi:excinuclease UvrABC ATPase subunit
LPLHGKIIDCIRIRGARTHNLRNIDLELRPGRFSFNFNGGRCEACHGDGVTRVEMHFLPKIYVTYDIRQG